MFAGGTLSWFVLMPMIALFGKDATIFPGSEVISTLAPGSLWELISSTLVPVPLQLVVS